MKIYTGRRGQTFERLLDYTNQIYQNQGRCLIQKRPTPVKVFKTHGRKVLSGVYESKSTVDYDGIYRNKAIVFEAKSTQIKTSFPLSMLANHQIQYLDNAEKHGAVSFVIIEMRAIGKVFVVPNTMIQKYVKESKTSGRKSIPVDVLETDAETVKQGNGIPLDYLQAVDKLIDSNLNSEIS